MKICFICRKDGQRRPRWLNMNIFRHYRRDTLYNILYKFNAKTYEMCYNSIAIRKYNGLLLGDLVLNNENKNKYGFHKECYRKLVSIKRKYIHAWQIATYINISDVYIHPDIDKNALGSQNEKPHLKPNRERKIKKEKKSSKKRDKNVVKIKNNCTTDNKTTEYISYAHICSRPVRINFAKSASDLKTIVPKITKCNAAKENQSVSLNTAAVPLISRIKQREMESNQGPDSPPKKKDMRIETTNKAVNGVQIGSSSALVKFLQSSSDDKIHVPAIASVKTTSVKENQSNATNIPASMTEKEKQSRTKTNQECEKTTQATTGMRNGLWGVSRRRFTCLLECNVPIEDAKLLARRHWSDLVKEGYIPSKTPRTAQSKFEEGTSKCEVEKTPISRKPPFKAGFKKPLYLGICNVRPMVREEMQKVHSALTNEINIEHSGIAPTLIKFMYRPGWMVVICADKYSEKWLAKKLFEIKPWPEAHLSTVPSRQLPKSTTAFIFIPKKENRSVMEILKQLKRQNRELNTEYWIVVSEKDTSAGRVIKLALDTLSVDALKKANCKAVFGFKTIYFNIQSRN